jgi:hypothetical protein
MIMMMTIWALTTNLKPLSWVIAVSNRLWNYGSLWMWRNPSHPIQHAYGSPNIIMITYISDWKTRRVSRTDEPLVFLLPDLTYEPIRGFTSWAVISYFPRNSHFLFSAGINLIKWCNFTDMCTSFVTKQGRFSMKITNTVYFNRNVC